MPWILGIAAWECRTWRKRRSRRRETALPPLLVDGHDPEAVVISRDLETALSDVMGALRPADRDTLLASMGACERPDIPGATFRKRLQRAMSRLRTAWSQEHG